jgi:hypothetical protein
MYILVPFDIRNTLRNDINVKSIKKNMVRNVGLKHLLNFKINLEVEMDVTREKYR